MPPGSLVRVQVSAAGNPLSTTLPVETLHVGSVIVPATGASGIKGGDSTFAETGSETHALSVVDLTSMVCRPAGTPVKVTPACHVPPSRLYSKLPVGAVMIMVPVGSAQVGWVISNVAAAGSGGGSSIVAEAGGDTQVLSVADLTSRVCRPDDTPAKVVEACQTPPSILYSYAPTGVRISIVPVVTAQVGCVMVTVAASGGFGNALMITSSDAAEVSNASFVTVKL